MRLGERASSLSTARDGKLHQQLGCYYCDDIVAPADVIPQPLFPLPTVLMYII